MNKIKILLADDHKIVIDGLRLILDSNENFDVVGDVENGQHVIDFIEEQKVDIVVLDINMPVMDGITCAKRIKSDYPNIKVIILTMYAQKSFVERYNAILDETGDPLKAEEEAWNQVREQYDVDDSGIWSREKVLV